MNDIKPIFPCKSLAGALLFSIFFGPVGLLYATSVGGIIMIIVGFVVICSRLIVPIILMWLICNVWSVVAVNRYNRKFFKLPTS